MQSDSIGHPPPPSLPSFLCNDSTSRRCESPSPSTLFYRQFQDILSSSVSSSLRKAFTNEWAIRVAGGRDEDVQRLADKYGYTNLGRVSLQMRFHFGLLKC